MIGIARRFLVFCLLSGLAACATRPCTGDPTTDPYHCADHALKSGLYQQQLEDLEARRSRLQLQHAALERRNRELTLELAAARTVTGDVKQKITVVDQRLLQLTEMLSKLNELHSVEEKTKADLEARLNSLLEQRENTKIDMMLRSRRHLTEDEAATLTNLEDQIDRLEAEMELSTSRAAEGSIKSPS